MKILPVLLKNNIESEFYISDSEASKLVLKQLVCTDAKTFDISRCVLSIDDTEVNFVKGDWTNPSVFFVNGLADKQIKKTIEPFSFIKFKLKINYSGQDEKFLEDIRFQLHLDLEPEAQLC